MGRCKKTDIINKNGKRQEKMQIQRKNPVCDVTGPALVHYKNKKEFQRFLSGAFLIVKV